MDLARIVLVFCLACPLVLGQAAVPSTIRVSSEVAPAGGMAQMKVLSTSPQPISSGDMEVSFSDFSFSSLNGIAAFSGTGDVHGAAVINSGKLALRFISPNGTFGTDGYPLMTATVAVPPTAASGQKYQVNLGSSSYWTNLLGSSIPVEIQQGSITVGGSVSITNVVPGGGVLPAGGFFTIQGIGFTPNTQVQVKGLSSPQIRYISPTQIQVTLKAPALLDGTQITAVNPDKSSDTYFSYLRAAEIGQSSRPLLAGTVPVFSINTGVAAALPSTISPLVNPDYFTAVALQNPNSSATVANRVACGGGRTYRERPDRHAALRTHFTGSIRTLRIHAGHW
jgi:hypothetical protein